MQGWNASQLWSVEYFAKEFGGELVQVYNDGFDLITVCTLSEYLDNYYFSPRPRDPVPYVRWYTKLKDVDFFWSDSVFERLKAHWGNPYFMPATGYLLPYCMPPHSINPAEAGFPAKSLFVSGAGAATRLHLDPWGSDSILFQLHGEKSWLMFSPDQREFLRRGDGSYVNLRSPDLEAFPLFRRASPTYEFRLRAGEAVYVPRGWLHEVETLVSSISLTWNFVHIVAVEDFLRYLGSGPSSQELEVLRYFLSGYIPKEAGVGEIDAFIRRCGPIAHREVSSDNASRHSCRPGPTAYRVVPSWRRMLLAALGFRGFRSPPADGVGDPISEPHGESSKSPGGTPASSGDHGRG
jgi:hypothetical protein